MFTVCLCVLAQFWAIDAQQKTNNFRHTHALNTPNPASEAQICQGEVQTHENHLSNLPESTESGRFKIRGFARSSDPFSFLDERQRFFLLPDEAERVRGPPDLIIVPSGNQKAEAGSMIRWVSVLSGFQTGRFLRFSYRHWQLVFALPEAARRPPR